MQNVLARHNAKRTARVQASSVKVKALHGQRARAHGRNVAEHAEEGRIQRVGKAHVLLFAPQQDKADRRFHPLVGKAEHEQQQNAPERHGAQVGQDLRQRVSEDEQKRGKKQRKRDRADEIGFFPAPVHACSPPVPLGPRSIL